MDELRSMQETGRKTFFLKMYIKCELHHENFKFMIERRKKKTLEVNITYIFQISIFSFLEQQNIKKLKFCIKKPHEKW